MKLHDFNIVQGERTAEDSLTKLQHSKHMAELLGNMLKKKYPNFNTRQFNIDDILEWKLWHGFMKIYGKYNHCHATHYVHIFMYSETKSLRHCQFV